MVNTRNAVANGGNTRNRIDDRESDTAMSTDNSKSRRNNNMNRNRNTMVILIIVLIMFTLLVVILMIITPERSIQRNRRQLATIATAEPWQQIGDSYRKAILFVGKPR